MKGMTTKKLEEKYERFSELESKWYNTDHKKAWPKFDLQRNRADRVARLEKATKELEEAKEEYLKAKEIFLKDKEKYKKVVLHLEAATLEAATPGTLDKELYNRKWRRVHRIRRLRDKVYDELCQHKNEYYGGNKKSEGMSRVLIKLLKSKKNHGNSTLEGVHISLCKKKPITFLKAVFREYMKRKWGIVYPNRGAHMLHLLFGKNSSKNRGTDRVEIRKCKNCSNNFLLVRKFESPTISTCGCTKKSSSKAFIRHISEKEFFQNIRFTKGVLHDHSNK